MASDVGKNIAGWLRRRLQWCDLRRGLRWRELPQFEDAYDSGSRGTLVLRRKKSPLEHMTLDYRALNGVYAVQLTPAEVENISKQLKDWRIEFRDRTATLISVNQLDPSDVSETVTALFHVDLASGRASGLSPDGIALHPIRRNGDTPAPDSVRALYGEVAAAWRQLTEVRFKLLALVPVLSGIGLFAILDSDGTLASTPRAVRAAAAAFGFVVTAGLMIYDRRNSILYDDLISRGKHLEHAMGFTTGVFLGRLKSRWPVNHGMALTLIYWATLLAWLSIFVAVVGGWVEADTGCQDRLLYCALLGLN